ncbi:hypothetical protein Y032_0047g1501 [Ancylostoma ceylanicum]|uniref:Uncharacterized protein n=1 Tax=Ancylostoma ceylanicum TaxID=53326 RepID=A0A016UBE2_9BILA|nr:hypothetical protein Y032_0047g1501 [Ancylostoma ceylanicum]
MPIRLLFSHSCLAVSYVLVFLFTCAMYALVMIELQRREVRGRTGTQHALEATAPMAAQLGLHALVADGFHSFQLRLFKREGQLYTVHGVCNNDVEVPLLYAISSKKTEQE